MALKSKKSSFQYKPRTAEQVKGRANRKAGNFDSIFKQGFDTFTPKQGDNLIRYLPPTWDDSEHYGYTVFTHNQIGPDNSSYLCARKMLNKPCACCEAQKDAFDAGEKDEADALKASERIVSWIIDREGDDPEKPVIYNQSWTQDRDVTSLCVNERTGEILMIDHPDKGYDVSFKRQGTMLKTKYYGWQIDRTATPINDNEKVQDEILEFIKENPIPDILNFYDYDYIKGVLSGAVEKKDKEMEDDEDDKPVRGRKSASKDEDDDAPFDTKKRGPRRDEEEDEEEEVKPRGRGRTVVEEEPEDEEVDEEEEDEKPAPRSIRDKKPTNTRARVVDEDEEEEPEDEAPPPRRSNRVR